jgi:hypothetical protein
VENLWISCGQTIKTLVNQETTEITKNKVREKPNKSTT